MSPSLTPEKPGDRYKIVVAKLDADGEVIDWIDFEGDTYVVAVTTDTPHHGPLGIDLDFTGDPASCMILLNQLANHVEDPSGR